MQRAISIGAVLLFAIFAFPVSENISSAQDAKDKPIKVFILAGQSNMQGHGIVEANPKRNGGKGSLEYLVKNPKTAKQFQHLVDADGKWIKRDDVWIWHFDRKGKLTVGYGARPGLIGPELQFGHVVGDHFEEPVLIIETSWGGRSLAVDFRPPSSGKLPAHFNEKLLERVKKDPSIVGKSYREMMTHINDVLKNLKTYFPAYQGQGYEIAGFGWHQGWNDRINQQFNDEYEKNLANFIRDIRKDLKVKNLPFVIAETGMSGPKEKHPRALSLMKAQAAVAKHKEFQANVAFVGTKQFYRPREESPSGQGYHWNQNAETYFLIGDAMGKAMIRLCEKRP